MERRGVKVDGFAPFPAGPEVTHDAAVGVTDVSSGAAGRDSERIRGREEAGLTGATTAAADGDNVGKWNNEGDHSENEKPCEEPPRRLRRKLHREKESDENPKETMVIESKSGRRCGYRR